LIGPTTMRLTNVAWSRMFGWQKSGYADLGANSGDGGNRTLTAPMRPRSMAPGA